MMIRHDELLRRAKEDLLSVLDRRGPHLFSFRSSSRCRGAYGFATPGATHLASEYTSSCEGDMPLPYVQEASVE